MGVNHEVRLKVAYIMTQIFGYDRKCTPILRKHVISVGYFVVLTGAGRFHVTIPLFFLKVEDDP